MTLPKKSHGEKVLVVLKNPSLRSSKSGRRMVGASSITRTGVPELLLIEWPEGEKAPTKYWLCWFGSHQMGTCQIVGIAKARWRIELDYREMKEELGLDHYEGRHWLGWYHHHVTLVTLAYAFLRAEQARIKKNFWCDLASGEEIAPGCAD